MRSRPIFTAWCSRSGVALCAVIIAACAGNGQGLDANGRPLVPGGNSSVPLSDDFESLQANIFTPICSVCHIGASAPQGLRLDAENSYNLLVAVPSTEVPSILRVKPGDPDNSYIIQKLEGHAAVGARMPFGGPYLTTDTIAFVREWITNGAQPAASGSAAAAPLSVTSIVPTNKETLGSAPPQVMIAFNHDLDLSQLDTHAAHFERIDGAAPQVLERIQAHIAAAGANPRALMLWPSRPLSPGRYRVVIDAGASAQFSDIAGQSVALGAPDELGEAVISTFDVEVAP